MKERKVLVVDDERAIREMLELAFNKIGYSVCSTSSAEEALDILAHESFPVMFIDLGLEKMNGFELCETIRRDSPDVIMYAVTGYAGLFGEQEIIEAGFDGCLGKPFSIGTIYEVTKESFDKLDKRAAHRAIRSILIADDDDSFRKMLRKMLENDGFEVGEAIDGNDAITRYTEKPFDLVITDIVMPRKAGIESIVDIKNIDPNAKFIAISGDDWYGVDAEFEIAKTLGVQTLRKPFERQVLLDTINQV